MPKAILIKKYGVGGIRFPDFRLYYKATVIKTVWYWHKNTNINQWNRIESPGYKPSHVGSVNTWQKGTSLYNTEKSVSSISGPRKTGQLRIKNKIKSEHSLTPYPKINPKRIKDLSVTPDTIKLLRGKHRQNTL